MEHNEYVELRDQLEADFDGRYVQIEDCNRIVKEESKKIDRLTIEFAKSNTKMSIIIGILSAIAVPILTASITALFNWLFG